MKILLSIAIVAMIAMATVFASPVFSGRFGVKYTFETDVLKSDDRNYMTLTDSNDIWSISFQGTGYNYHRCDASATIDVAAGQYENYVYAYPNSMVDNYYELGLATSSDRPFALSAGYNGCTAIVVAGIETDKSAVGFDVTGTILDGVDVEAVYSTEGEGAAQTSVMVNVEKLSDLDFTAKVFAYDFFDLEDSENNKYPTALNLGYGPVSGSVEYRNVAAKNGLWVKAPYKVNSLFSVGAGVNASNLTEAGDTLGFNVNATVKISGITTYVEVFKTALTTYTQFTL